MYGFHITTTYYLYEFIKYLITLNFSLLQSSFSLSYA